MTTKIRKRQLQKISKISRKIFQVDVFEIIFRIDEIAVICYTRRELQAELVHRNMRLVAGRLHFNRNDLRASRQ